jgi:hypothetical protein
MEARVRSTAASAAACSPPSAGRCGNVGQELGAALAADLDEEPVAAVVHDLRQREVVPPETLGPVPIEAQKQSPRRASS